MLTRLLTLVQVGYYWKYAIKAITFVLLYFRVCNYDFIFHAITAMILEYAVQWKIHMHESNDKWLNKRFPVLPLGLAQVLLVITFSGS